jgi:single-strand DNA-binding protein
MPDNTVTLVGNITDDPELRFTPSGAAVANFTIAVNRRIQGKDGNWEDRNDGFFRCTAWRQMAENVAESLEKGARVILTGRLQQSSWDTEEGKRSRVEVQVDEIGPSLRWATAKPQKTNRSTPSSAAGGGGGGEPGGDWSSPSPVGAPEEGGF